MLEQRAVFVDEVLDRVEAVSDYCWSRIADACQASLLLIDCHCLEVPELSRVIRYAKQIQERRYGGLFELEVLRKDATDLCGQFLMACLLYTSPSPRDS